MKRRILVFSQIALLLIMCFPAVVMADSAPQTTVSLSKTTASVGDNVNVSGKTATGAWVPLKVVDEAGNIVVFDVTKAESNGNYNINFIVPTGVSGTLTVVVGEGDNVDTRELKIQTSGGSPGGGGSGPAAQPVTSTAGAATVKPSAGGTISLGNEATIDIPANALTGTGAKEVKVTKVTAPPEVPVGLKLAGTVYEFSVGGQSSYNFAKEVTITLSFDPSMLEAGETPNIYYYDQVQKKWINLGGKVTGNTVSVQVDHFTQFALMAEVEAFPVIAEPGQINLTDINGHWAEDNIKKLVALGAVSGYPDSTFKPDNNITRSEFTTILVKAFDLKLKSGGKVFADTVGHWAEESIAIAASHGIVNGYDENTFGPDETITREQMAVMVINAAQLTPISAELSFVDSSSISVWAQECIAAAVNNGIISGYPDNTVRPQGKATRCEAVTVIVNAL